jgi:hypothetical protein
MPSDERSYSPARNPRCSVRVTAETIREVVEHHKLKCTHFDAYRFFTPAAEPLNRIPLTRATVSEHEQPGCIHTTMDLYKAAFNVAPFVAGELLAEAFDIATEARAIDMRASPYDLSGYGYAAIAIETRTGQEEYVNAQRSLAERAKTTRGQLLWVYESLIAGRESNMR